MSSAITKVMSTLFARKAIASCWVPTRPKQNTSVTKIIFRIPLSWADRLENSLRQIEIPHPSRVSTTMSIPHIRRKSRSSPINSTKPTIGAENRKYADRLFVLVSTAQVAVSTIIFICIQNISSRGVWRHNNTLSRVRDSIVISTLGSSYLGKV